MTYSKEDEPGDIQRLEGLIEAWQAGGITSQEWDALRALLRESPAIRDRFLLHMQIEAELHWRFSERSRVSAVLAEDFPQTAPPLNPSRLADGSYSRDDTYRNVVDIVANQEANDLIWAQAYPRLRSYVALCLSRPMDVESAVSAIGKRIIDRYHDRLSSTEFIELIRRSARWEIEERLANQGGPARVLEGLIAQACLCQPEDRAITNTSALYERLEAYVPYRLSEDRLQLLCLRYLHELTPEQIAVHLATTRERVQLELAKARILIWKQCCESPFQKASQPEIDHLLIANVLVDRRTLNSEALAQLQTWLVEKDRHRQMFSSFALLHECISRQLSLQSLLESLTECRSKPFQNAVGKAIRQIELFSRKKPATLPAAPPRAERQWVAVAAIATAAVLLVAVALTLRQPAQRLDQPQVAFKRPSAPVVVPAVPQTLKVPPPPPIVATVTELLDAQPNSAPRIGAEVRQGEAVPLHNGIMQLVTTSGSTIVIEAPAEVLFESEHKIALKQGKLAGRNSTKEQVLIVHTPTATIEDLGTEFGVGVREDGATSIAVYEGAVDVSGTEPEAERRTLQVGWQTSISELGSLAAKTSKLVHNRAFVRPDEVQLRIAAKLGSESARSEIALYELLRIDGILAYHGFGTGSQDKQQAIGFLPQGLRSSQGVMYGANLSSGTPLSVQSQSIVAADERRYFLDLDTSERSGLVQAGLLAPGGLVGDQPGEIWLSWRSQLELPQGGLPEWAGLSLMCGDMRQTDEPLFVGLTAGQSSYGIAVFEAINRSELHGYQLDRDAAIDDVQPMLASDQQVLWIVQLLMNPNSSEVRVWCNVPADQVAVAPPNARQSIENLRFDRFRLELASPKTPATCSFDDLVITKDRESMVAALDIIGGSVQSAHAK